MACIKLNSIFVEIDEKELTVLEWLEKNGFNINYQCRVGTCGTCRCQLVSGEIEYIKEPLSFIKDGDILACVAKIK